MAGVNGSTYLANQQLINSGKLGNDYAYTLNNSGDITTFNEGAYLAANPDVAAAVSRGEMSALGHYNTYGMAEGRDPWGRTQTAPITYNLDGGGTYTAAARPLGQSANTANVNDPYDYMRWIGDLNPDFDADPNALAARDYFQYSNGKEYDHVLSAAELQAYNNPTMTGSRVADNGYGGSSAGAYTSSPATQQATTNQNAPAGSSNTAIYKLTGGESALPGNSGVANYSFQPYTQPAPTYQGLMGGDYDALQSALAVKGKQAADNAYQGASQQLNNVMSGRGLYGSSIMQNQQTKGLDREYMNALSANEAAAAAQRYALQQGDLQKAADIQMAGWNGLLNQSNVMNQIAGTLANTSLNNSSAFDIAKLNSDTTRYNTDKNYAASINKDLTSSSIAQLQAGTSAAKLAQDYKLATSAQDQAAIAGVLKGLGWVLGPDGKFVMDTAGGLLDSASNWFSGDSWTPSISDTEYLGWD